MHKADLVNKTMQRKITIVIPARYNATRLPGKPLAEIHGKPMVQRVYELARQVPEAQAVLVATDDERIQAAVQAFGGQCVMTSPHHPSGTDRLAEVMALAPAEVYINVQCDEPLVRPEDVSVLAQGMLSDVKLQVGTLCCPLPAGEASNPNIVKVVLTADRDALYFSRAPIPYPRDGDKASYLKHVGIYAYRREVLAVYSQLARPMIEQAEQLEQLRLLAAGYRIKVFPIPPVGPGVDTPACLERVRTLIGQAE
jgi:3-deoxy-manno-octulosonate cytidylyltransferase (CMP-KDO synthetase)